MGYTTEFDGAVSIDPPLNAAEIAYITKFGDTRRMKRAKGPYYVDGSGYAGQDREDDIIDYNYPPDGQPGLWCQWVPSPDGSEIIWDGSEKFYCSEEWMRYLIDTFLKEGCTVQREILALERSALELPSSADDHLEQFRGFTFDHVANGTIDAQGEDAEDRWSLIVVDNEVSTQSAKVVWD
jgi:hypothetical protein